MDIEFLGGIFWQDKSERTENYRGELRSENLPCLSASVPQLQQEEIEERVFSDGKLRADQNRMQ